MKNSHIALLSLATTLLTSACGDPATNNPGDGGTADGGRRRLGMITVNGHTGVGYDLNGDGDPEGIDIDGDGTLDGEDLDNDGQITVWGDFRSRTLRSGATDGMPSTDPDLFSSLDPSNPPENLSSTGTVNEPARVVNDVPAGTLISRSQGGQGSCAAFTVAAAATLVRYHYDRAAMPMATPMINADTYWASAAWLYTRMVRVSSSMVCDQGTAISAGLGLLATGGAATWTEQPYRSGAMPMLCETIDKTTAQSPHVYRIGSYARVLGAGMAFRARVRESVAAGLPVAFGAQLPDGFMAFKSSTPGVNVTEAFRGSGMCTGSTHCGGHGMVITGYDDAKNAYRVLNSWGTDWGNNGYLWWDYASLEGLVGLDAYVIVPLPTAPTPLAAPNAAGLTMTQPAGSRVALVQQTINGTMRWTVIARVLFNEPVTVTNVGADLDGSVFNFSQSSGMSYGDIVGILLTDTMPAAGTMTTLTVSARLRDGTMVDRTLTVALPAPSML
jgi:hypothetical protein